MKRLLFLLLLLIPCYAQAQTSPPDTLRSEIGFSTNIIFDNIFRSSSYTTPVELMYKHTIGKNRIRAGIGLAQNNSKKETELGYMFEQNIKYLSVSPSVGYEVRTQLYGRWNFQWGSDFVYGYQFRSDTLYRTVPNQQHPYNSKKTEYTHRFSLRPFIGIMFNVNARLYLSTEMTFAASYLYKSEENIVMMYDYDQNGESRRYKSWEMYTTKETLFSLIPASTIFVYYRF